MSRNLFWSQQYHAIYWFCTQKRKDSFLTNKIKYMIPPIWKLNSKEGLINSFLLFHQPAAIPNRVIHPGALSILQLLDSILCHRWECHITLTLSLFSWWKKRWCVTRMEGITTLSSRPHSKMVFGRVLSLAGTEIMKLLMREKMYT